MNKWLGKRYFIPVIYLVITVICIFLTFDFEGSTNIIGWLILSILTLPWSLISILFLWAIMHGAGLEFFAGMYLVFAVINTLLFYYFNKSKYEED
jgi:hypothetical protein